MKKINLLIVALATVSQLSANNYYNGLSDSVNERSDVHYHVLKKYSVVLDGENVSTVDLNKLTENMVLKN